MSDSPPRPPPLPDTISTGGGLLGLQHEAESGIPTFRGAGGLWRTYAAQELATPRAFKANPSPVWEFYHYRRQVVAGCRPNDGHVAVAALQRRLAAQGKRCSVITQNIDRLHQVMAIELWAGFWSGVSILVRLGRCCPVRTQPAPLSNHSPPHI